MRAGSNQVYVMDAVPLISAQECAPQVQTPSAVDSIAATNVSTHRGSVATDATGIKYKVAERLADIVYLSFFFFLYIASIL